MPFRGMVRFPTLVALDDNPGCWRRTILLHVATVTTSQTTRGRQSFQHRPTNL